MVPDAAAIVPIVVFPIIGILFAFLYKSQIGKIKLSASDGNGGENQSLNRLVTADKIEEMAKITGIIQKGAKTFLWAEYKYMGIFMVLFGALVFVFLGVSGHGAAHLSSWAMAGFTTLSFVAGSVTSIISGYIGMDIATFTNGRVSLEAIKGFETSFVIAFKGGVVMGFALTSLAILVLFVLVCIFKAAIGWNSMEDVRLIMECLTGYGLGGSSIALFGRVGGGIYTKAADVGSDLVGKTEAGLEEDSPDNPGTIADNVGDNVGDIAGMGADLFGSFAESTCACFVVAASSPTHDFVTYYPSMMYPLLISACGIIVSLITSFVATNLMKVTVEKQIEERLKQQLLISTLLMTPVLYVLSIAYLPATFQIGAGDNLKTVKNYYMFFASALGLWTGLLIGYTTEYYTSKANSPVLELTEKCKMGGEAGAATNIIAGLALGYKSAIPPTLAMAVTIFVSYTLAGMYGIGISALGILSTMAVGLTIDAYGPISDNAGGIVEMADIGREVRARTDALDAAGNTTAAIGKGFAISSAAMVSLALFGAFTTRSNIEKVDILQAFPFAGLLVGAMLPYAFSAMTMKSVGDAAVGMVEEIRRQLKDKEKLEAEGKVWKPDHESCIAVSTTASLREMIAPGILVMGTPLITGVLFGCQCLAGVLAGSLVSSVQLAISASNTGGAWDNCKKWIENDSEKPPYNWPQGKGSAPHKAAVVGDTVGDPLKDTSGPALNILMKLAAVESLVFAPFFLYIKDGKGLVGYFS
jgi:inorganic pyrophosphatase